MASLFLLPFLLATAFSFTLNDYRTSKNFHGEGTYYGGNPYTGNCAIRAPLPKGTYAGRLAVAISDEQYDVACGACLTITGTGKGLGANPIIGPIKAYVSDRCYECKHGDLDLSSVGDGRWEINWKVEPCNTAPRIQFLFEGSNLHYWKLQPRGMSGPCTQMLIDGKPAVLKQDNHWVYETRKAKKSAKVTVKTVMGEVIESWVTMVPRGTTNGAALKPRRRRRRGGRRWRRRWRRRIRSWGKKRRWNKRRAWKPRWKKTWRRKPKWNKQRRFGRRRRRHGWRSKHVESSDWVWKWWTWIDCIISEESVNNWILKTAQWSWTGRCCTAKAHCLQS